MGPLQYSLKENEDIAYYFSRIDTRHQVLARTTSDSGLVWCALLYPPGFFYQQTRLYKKIISSCSSLYISLVGYLCAVSAYMTNDVDSNLVLPGLHSAVHCINAGICDVG